MKSPQLLWFLLLLAGATVLFSSARAAEFSPTLETELAQKSGTDFVSAIVILQSPIDIQALDAKLHAERAGKVRRHKEVLDALHYNADITQPQFRTELDQAKRAGVLQGYTAYWIENLFVIYAQKDFITSFRPRGDIKVVTENFVAETIQPIRIPEKDGSQRGRNPLDTRLVPPGIQAIGALRVNEELGITGNGVIVGNMDTGVDGTHPALAARWRGVGGARPWQECWRDALHTTSFPTNNGDHGTHVMGTMCGRAISGTDTTWIGCAPSAKWIADRAVDQGQSQTQFVNDVIDGYQWFADPDTITHSAAAVPDVVQNSWGVRGSFGPPYTECFDQWNTVVLNCEAAGVVVTWSAGNEGTSGLRAPAIWSISEVDIFSVGAVDASAYPTTPYPIASFSSQGPTTCTPAVPNTIKPEISAPGVNIYSSIPGGGYDGTYSGTSMAGPHVAGIVALMREACPDCDPTTIKMAIINTAIRTGYVTPPATENNIFGNGFIDGYSAVLAVSNLGRVAGVVRDASSAPLAGVTVKNAAGAQSVLTNASGQYYLPLQAGTYTIQYSKFGYIAQNAPGIVIVTGDTTIHNVTLQSAPQGTVSGTVTSCAGGPAVGATVEVLNTPVSPATTNGSGFYSITLPQGTYDMKASGAGCGAQTVTGVVIGATATQNFTLPTDPRFLCSAPDAANYIACENGDAGGPTYSWLEISPLASGPGTNLNLAADDNFATVALPFTYRHYGKNYTTCYVATNGFVTFDYGSTAYSNSTLPTASIGHAVCPFWDDLNTTSAGDISTYYNTTLHAFIIEWHVVPHFSGGGPETFQVWLYDYTTNPAPNGNSQLRMQYQTVVDASSCTVGVQDSTRANSYVANGALDVNAQGLANNRVISYGEGSGVTLGTIAGTIINCTGGAAANATVTFPGSPYGSVTTNASGFYTTSVIPGTYSVRADKSPCTYIQSNGNVVTAGNTTTVNMTLRAPTAIQGTITNCTGGAAAGAIVSFPSSSYGNDTTNAGGFYIQYLNAGTYTVKASKFPCTDIQQNNVVVNEAQIVTVNLTLLPAGTLQGTVLSCAGGPAVGATMTLVGTTITPVVTNASGFYQFALPAGTYTLAVSFAGCASDTAVGLVVTSGGTTTRNFTLITNPAFQCSPADAYGYTACENVDPTGPAFSWRAVAPSEGGTGTLVSGLTDDSYAGPFTLPFPFKMYGTTYTQYYVSSNGFITFGSGNSTYGNICLPTATMPAGLYTFWDDMYPPLGGQVAYYNNTATHEYVIEYYQINHYNTGPPESFEAIILDAGYFPTTTGDNDIIFQYNTAASITANTVGIQNAGTIAQQYLCNNVKPTTAFGLAAGRAILFSTGHCFGSSTISINPGSVTGHALVGGTDSQILQICDIGLCPLSWSLSFTQTTPLATFTMPESPVVVSVSKAEALAMQSAYDPSKYQHDEGSGRGPLDFFGGPDSYGYRWKDSHEAGGPMYNWAEIKTIGTNTGLTLDDQVLAFHLPWTYPFYGGGFDSVRISSNGNLHFGTANTAYGNTALPNTSAPFYMVAPFWDDLNLTLGGHVYYYNDVANNRYIVQWDSVPHYALTGVGVYTFEAILSRTGGMLFQYRDMRDTLNSATIGIQNGDGTVGLQVVYNANYVTNGLAIQINGPWLAATPTSGSFPEGQCGNVTLSFDAGGLAAGTYSGQLLVQSNDPAHNPSNIPITFVVGNASLNVPDSLTIAFDPGTSMITLRWSAVPGAALYRIFTGTSADAISDFLGTSNTNSKTFALPGDNLRFYKVIASDGVTAVSQPTELPRSSTSR